MQRLQQTDRHTGSTASTPVVSGVSETVALATLPADVWTALPAAPTLTSVVDFKVFDASDSELELESRRFGTSFQIRSSVTLNSLRIELEG